MREDSRPLSGSPVPSRRSLAVLPYALVRTVLELAAAPFHFVAFLCTRRRQRREMERLLRESGGGGKA